MPAADPPTVSHAAPPVGPRMHLVVHPDNGDSADKRGDGRNLPAVRTSGPRLYAEAFRGIT
jgi:hypothetical protein